jgi:hypothetical protein
MIRQSTLGKELGVSRVTVSIMVRALERLGLVRRVQSLAPDRRQVVVSLIVWMAIYSIFRMDGERVGALHYYLEEVRRVFSDPARFYFSWCDRTLFPERRWKTPPPFQWPKAVKAVKAVKAKTIAIAA